MRKIILLFFLLAVLGIPGVGFSYTFQDDFNDGDLDGWAPKIGNWSVGGTSNKYLVNSGSPYGVLWEEHSLGVYQKLQVDAYFDLTASIDDQIAHLRLRTNEHAGTSQPFWDTGYLAEFGLNEVRILNTYLNGNPVITSSPFAYNPFTYTGWYKLAFGVDGIGADTHFNMWINDGEYIDYDYNNSIDALDSGYVGLGRCIQYDNAQGYSSNTPAPVPEPTTMLLLGSGLIGLVGFRKRLGRK